MKKEIIIAIVIGFVIGLFITFGVYRANRAITDSKSEKTEEKTADTEASPLIASPIPSFTVSQPENNLVFKTPQATVSGQAQPGTTIAILAEDQEELLVTDDQGFFNTNISLISGVNQIKIIAIDQQGKSEEKTINVVYSTADIE